MSNQKYFEGMSILYVEDDMVGRAIIDKMLEPLFAVRYAAVNGEEGLELFRKYRPSIVVSDLMMPVMDGIEMLRAIRSMDQKTPVVLMTASLDNELLVDAINLGVSKFLAKPLSYDVVQRSLQTIAKEISLEKIVLQARSKEIELLRYRDRYHSRQEELARRKEQHILHNGMAELFLPCADGSGWVVSLVHKPKDVMSGDSYSVRLTEQGKLLVYLADAMGHGLSASVTSMLVTAYFNHAVDHCPLSGDFAAMAHNLTCFITENILDDEVFSCTLLEIDPEHNQMQIAACGMPPLYQMRNSLVEQLVGDNPPLTAFSGAVKISKISLGGISDILLTTDGLPDAQIAKEDSSYFHRLSDDLAVSGTANELFDQFRSSCPPRDDDDDITLIYLQRSSFDNPEKTVRFSCSGTLSDVAALQGRIMQHLEANGATGSRLESFDLAIGEALMNALEHGCLQMGANKRQLLLSGEYDDMIMSATAKDGEKITVSVGLADKGERLQCWLEVTDPGSGVLQEQLTARRSATAPCGRGLALMKRSVDLMRVSPQGGRLLLLQMLERLH
ncbi:MAG: fused response regulator/phosphatase [Trichlorobacter sp.]|nr:fused response regulator/phosphatase [Trichlorobacter sp.]